MIIGIQGVQGSGKTTLTEKLVKKNNWECISLDDFYLPYQDMCDLYEYTNESAWKVRGNPGTHDVQLLLNVLTNFKQKKECTVPIYDKYAKNSKGDRVGTRVLKPCSVLLLEGWCLGFESLGLGTNVDEALKDYQPVYDMFDGMVILKPPYINIVYKWREEAERCMRTMGKGMSEEQVKSFVDVYMKTYETYLVDFYNKYRLCPTLFVELNTDRVPTSATIDNCGKSIYFQTQLGMQ
jgi:D-glycerate 3-kinase